jgi:esterase/lipase superfamily enzyme
MEKRYYSEYSQCLDRNMDFIVYGHSGVPLLVFPAQDGHPQDYENFGMVDVIKDKMVMYNCFVSEALMKKVILMKWETKHVVVIY